MCGIAGWYRRRGRTVEENAIKRACNTILHRGPDDWGVFTCGDFGMGMRRLSIIDIAGGHQPIFSEDRRWAISFNGEIYNHLDLRPELEAWGWRFRTHSDTETLLAAYVRWGDDAWLKLDGMYAAAIWDSAERRLTLARDPLGIKPLYYTLQHGGIAWGSEIRAIRALDLPDFTLCERAVHDFFMFGHVQKPRTIWNEIQSLDPGHVMHVGAEGDPVIREFWYPRFTEQSNLSESEWIDATRSELLATVKRHMLADVPVGAFLSGGVDSSAIAAAMVRATNEPIKLFTVGFPGTSIDETKQAARIARHLGCEHFILELAPQNAATILPQVQASHDQPCAATAAVPVWHVSKFAAEHVKVVLCGEGSDEIFAGYKRQRTALFADRLQPVMRLLEPLAGAATHLPFLDQKRRNYLRQNLRRFQLSASLNNSFQRFFQGTQISTPWVREAFYETGFHARQDSENIFARLDQEYFSRPDAQNLNPLEQFMLADITIHMPSSLLNRTDLGSMAHSLEARVPYLSHKFVDWALTMPRNMKLRGKVGKYALRKAVEPWLFPGALDTRKLGFQLPFAEWFSGDFSHFARETWHDSGAAKSGYLRTDGVDKLFAEHAAGLANHGRILYAIAMFSCWWNQTFNAR